jgi:hypothetical protein
MKPIACYGKKPRGSATSKKAVINGIAVFLNFSKTSTHGNIIVYSMKEPYPRICVASGNDYYDCLDRIEAFFAKHGLEIQSKLDMLDSNMCFPKEVLDKALKNKGGDYKIVTSKDKEDGMRLVVSNPEHGEIEYLYVDPDEAPRKDDKIDTEKVKAEWLRRKNG